METKMNFVTVTAILWVLMFEFGIGNEIEEFYPSSQEWAEMEKMIQPLAYIKKNNAKNNGEKNSGTVLLNSDSGKNLGAKPSNCRSNSIQVFHGLDNKAIANQKINLPINETRNPRKITVLSNMYVRKINEAQKLRRKISVFSNKKINEIHKLRRKTSVLSKKPDKEINGKTARSLFSIFSKKSYEGVRKINNRNNEKRYRFTSNPLQIKMKSITFDNSSFYAQYEDNENTISKSTTNHKSSKKLLLNYHINISPYAVSKSYFENNNNMTLNKTVSSDAIYVSSTEGSNKTLAHPKLSKIVVAAIISGIIAFIGFTGAAIFTCKKYNCLRSSERQPLIR